MLGRLFSSRIRELERQNADLRALLDKDFDSVSCTRMSYDERRGFEADFKTSAGSIIASWAVNTLKACGAKNYVEFSIFHPEDGAFVITVQKRSGETPGAKARRLESELALLRMNRGDQPA